MISCIFSDKIKADKIQIQEQQRIKSIRVYTLEWILLNVGMKEIAFQLYCDLIKTAQLNLQNGKIKIFMRLIGFQIENELESSINSDQIQKQFNEIYLQSIEVQSIVQRILIAYKIIQTNELQQQDPNKKQNTNALNNEMNFYPIYHKSGFLEHLQASRILHIMLEEEKIQTKIVEEYLLRQANKDVNYKIDSQDNLKIESVIQTVLYFYQVHRFKLFRQLQLQIELLNAGKNQQNPPFHLFHQSVITIFPKQSQSQIERLYCKFIRNVAEKSKPFYLSLLQLVPLLFDEYKAQKQQTSILQPQDQLFQAVADFKSQQQYDTQEYVVHLKQSYMLYSNNYDPLSQIQLQSELYKILKALIENEEEENEALQQVNIHLKFIVQLHQQFQNALGSLEHKISSKSAIKDRINLQEQIEQNWGIFRQLIFEASSKDELPPNQMASIKKI